MHDAPKDVLPAAGPSHRTAGVDWAKTRPSITPSRRSSSPTNRWLDIGLGRQLGVRPP